MKSTDYKKSCPVCNTPVAVESINLHISHKARRERSSNLQTDRKHHIYQMMNGTNKEK